MIVQLLTWVCYVLIGFGVADLTNGLYIDFPGIRYWRYSKRHLSRLGDVVLIIIGLIGLVIISMVN